MWLRTNGVSTNGAAAKVMKFDGLEKKVRPGTSGKINSRLAGVPKKSLCPQKMKSAVTPVVLTPFVPLRTTFMGGNAGIYTGVQLINIYIYIYIYIYTHVCVYIYIYIYIYSSKA